MIISKDLFIFGEHIFGTIIPESSGSISASAVTTTTTTTVTSTSTIPPINTTSSNYQHHNRHHHQQHQYDNTHQSNCFHSIDQNDEMFNQLSVDSTMMSEDEESTPCEIKTKNTNPILTEELEITNATNLKQHYITSSSSQSSTSPCCLSSGISTIHSQTNVNERLYAFNSCLHSKDKIKPTSSTDGVLDSFQSKQQSGTIESEKMQKIHGDRNQHKVMLDKNSRNESSTSVAIPFSTEPQRNLQLSFQNVTVLHNERKILNDVSGIVSPGEVLAIMGPSGSGKTTLLDCLSGQRRIDCGSIHLNREMLSKKWRRKICYVLQEEIFFSGLTLKETVMYTALLRLPEEIPVTEKAKLVDDILQSLELTFCQDTKFGDYMNRGLSGGEKKRANIACELLTNPLLMLLDEPTSGLDSHSAISLMKILKRYATEEQKTIVITVHQPSSQMFHMFDKLLLLYNGTTAYFGEVKDIYRYFENIGVSIKPHYNPAEFVLEQLKSNPDIREKLFVAAKESHGNFLNRNCIIQSGFINVHMDTKPKNHQLIAPIDVNNKHSSQRDALITDILSNYYKDVHKNHSQNIILVNDHHDIEHQHHHDDLNGVEEATQQLWNGGDSQSNFSSASSCCRSRDWLDYPTRFYTQFHVLSSRNFKEAKSRMLSKLNWFQTVGLALMAGAIWFDIPRTEEYLHDLQGWMFFSQTYWMLFALFGALNSFPSEREVINKERRSGSYRLSAYYLAKMFGELPLVVTLPTVYLMISYPMLGCVSVGFFIGACCMDMNVSITLSALYTLATQLFGGYLSTRIPDFLSWIRYTSMIHYAYQNMQILEFSEGPPIECSQPSSYEVCKSNNTKYIPYEEILKAQNSSSPLWLNTLVLMMFFLVFRCFGYAVLRYIRCPKT
ncbi:ABC transporter G family member 14 isoform X2 [Lucilia sericata]|uniref:ABC transporter G family member 14 isoform X2 n=1 Tax=Lucilia sericata TaxID=13632 RepID=UPI0018A7EAD6|nr:ABC transporter G family member 14 isoform X2 [Lucilia sericata]